MLDRVVIKYGFFLHGVWECISLVLCVGLDAVLCLIGVRLTWGMRGVYVGCL